MYPITHGSRVAKQQRNRWWFLWLSFLLLLALSGVACDLGPSPIPDPPSVVVVTLPPSVTYREEVTVNVVADITASFPRPLLLTFLQQMAGWIETIPRVNSSQATIYVTYLSHAPYQPDASPLAFTIPGVANWPVQPQFTPVPSCPDNPWQCSNAQATVTTWNSAQTDKYQQQLKAVQGQLAAAQTATKQQTAKLRALRPATDYIASSVWGVLSLAAERFRGVSGEKWLIIASDLINTTTLDEVPPQLNGVHLIVELYCVSAVACQRTERTWTAVFHQAQVASIRWLEPAEALTAASPWS